MTSNSGTEIRLLTGIGVCVEFSRSLPEAVRRQPQFIGCDCESADPEPAPLGAGSTAFPQVAIKRDLRLMLLGGSNIHP